MPYIFKIPVYLETNEYGEELYDHRVGIVSDKTDVKTAVETILTDDFEMTWGELKLENDIARKMDAYWLNVFLTFPEADQIKLTKFFGMVPVNVICRIANGSTVDEEIVNHLHEEYRAKNVQFACIERILHYAMRDYANETQYSCFLEFAIKNMAEFKKKYYTAYWGENIYYTLDTQEHLSQLLNYQIELAKTNINKLEAELDETVPNWRYRFFELALTRMNNKQELNISFSDDTNYLSSIAYIEDWSDIVIV
jgi:hypothetical protein